MKIETVEELIELIDISTEMFKESTLLEGEDRAILEEVMWKASSKKSKIKGML